MKKKHGPAWGVRPKGISGPAGREPGFAQGVFSRGPGKKKMKTHHPPTALGVFRFERPHTSPGPKNKTSGGEGRGARGPFARNWRGRSPRKKKQQPAGQPAGASLRPPGPPPTKKTTTNLPLMGVRLTAPQHTRGPGGERQLGTFPAGGRGRERAREAGGGGNPGGFVSGPQPFLLSGGGD